jgi:hypothetical protein
MKHPFKYFFAGKKIGSNFKIFERALSYEFKMPWKIISNFNSKVGGGTALNSFISKCEVQRCLLNDIRTWFEQNPQG